MDLSRMRMAGKGIKKVSGFGQGDHYIDVKIKPPQTLTEKQAALLKAYAEIEKDTPGTVRGLTYAVGGKKVVMEDKDGLVADIRSALGYYAVVVQTDICREALEDEDKSKEGEESA